VSQQQCHNNRVTTTVSQQKCHNSITTTVSQQQSHNNNVTTTVSQQQCHKCHNNNVTTVSQQQCRNSKFVIFQEKLFKVLKCYNFPWVQQRHNCSPAVSFENCVMTLYLLKVNLQTFLSIPINQKCQILSCDTLVANEQYVSTELKYHIL